MDIQRIISLVKETKGIITNRQIVVQKLCFRVQKPIGL